MTHFKDKDKDKDKVKVKVKVKGLGDRQALLPPISALSDRAGL